MPEKRCPALTINFLANLLANPLRSCIPDFPLVCLDPALAHLRQGHIARTGFVSFEHAHHETAKLTPAGVARSATLKDIWEYRRSARLETISLSQVPS